MIKNLREAIIKRSQLKTSTLQLSRKFTLFQGQNNFYSKLYNKEGKKYYLTVTDCIMYWKAKL